MSIKRRLEKVNLSIADIGVFALDESLDKVVADLVEVGELEGFTEMELWKIKGMVYDKLLE